MENFKDNRVRLLIATDVASRGLDVRDITYVINYDMPKIIEDYVHRIGRTGRAGAHGISVTFFATDEDIRLANDLIDVINFYLSIYLIL
jgi:ATP-dependent RNA helicase DDX5/DBP2